MPQPHKQPGAIASTPPAWAVGMERLQPAVYKDTSGALHVSIGELMQLHGLPFSDVSEEEFTAAIMQLFRERYPGFRTTEVHHGN